MMVFLPPVVISPPALRPKNVLLERINKRVNQGGRDIPEYVIDKMLNQFENPTNEEGFTEIYYV